MNRHRIAILVDGAFLLQRLPKLVKEHYHKTPKSTAGCIRFICKNHVKMLTGDDDTRWHRHVYRIFYYDATPYEGKSHHPLMNRSVDFAKSDLAAWRTELFEQLRSQRKFALRLGKVARDGDWSLPPNRVKKLLKTRDWITGLDFDDPSSALTDTQREEGKRIQAAWAVVQDTDVSLNLKQKGVDMRIGLDIASIALKRQADTIVLIAGDSDFVPAAKFARREGMEFILDPLWQKVNSDLFEHIDGLQSGLKKPTGTEGVAPVTGSSNNPDEPE